jgi:hypothetical protein
MRTSLEPRPAPHRGHGPAPLLLVAVLLLAAPAAPAGEGDVLGQDPPGDVPRLFAPGIVSTHRDELNAVFSPDGALFLTAVKLPYGGHHTLLGMSRTARGWTDPEVLPFSGVWSDADPAFTTDGRSVFFISTRPASGDRPASWDIFVVDRTETGWGEPRNLGAPVNTDALEVHPSLTDDGTLYFSSSREGGFGGNDIYRTRREGGAWREPENLGPAVNTEWSEGDLCVARDGHYLVFSSAGRPDDLGRGDLYVSFRAADGSWTTARHLGTEINSRLQEESPAGAPR